MAKINAMPRLRGNGKYNAAMIGVWQRFRAVQAVVLALVAFCLLVLLTACGTEVGVVAVGPTDDGLIAMTASYGTHGSQELFPYRSHDGGLTWTSRDMTGDTYEWPRAIIPEQDAVSTPRGVYTVDPTGIVLRTDTDERTVYSTAYLQSSGNLWLQSKQTEHLGKREPSTIPRSVTYDPETGNVIAAMGILGVVVETPDEHWTPVEVGPYTPVDFSALARVETLLSDLKFWITVLTLPLSMLAAALYSKLLLRGDIGFVEVLLALLTAASVGLASVLLSWTDDAFLSLRPDIELVRSWLFAAASVLFATPAIMAGLARQPRAPWRPILLGYAAMVVLVTLSLLGCMLMDWPFGVSVLLVVVMWLGTTIALARHLLRLHPVQS